MRPVFAAMIFFWTLLASPAFAQGFSDRHGWMMNWGWGHMAFGGLIMVVFWGGIILLVILLARALSWLGQRPSSDRQRPLEILRERFAQGEIDQKEYEERQRILSNRN